MKTLTNKDLEYLMAKTLKIAPNNPSGQGMSAETIKKLYYEGFQVLFNWIKGVQADFIVDGSWLNEYREFKDLVKTKYFTINLNANVSDGVISGVNNTGFLNDYLNREYDKVAVVSFGNYVLVNAKIENGTPRTIKGIATDLENNIYYATINVGNDNTITGSLIKLSTENDIENLVAQVNALPTKPYVDTELNKKIDKTSMGVNNGVATLDENGRIPSTQLPDGYDDVLEFASMSDFPPTGEKSKIYNAKDTNKFYRWGGTGYAPMNAELALGETAQTAYAGNKGKLNADNIATLQIKTTALENSLAGKVDKVSGKGLSTNDFTNAYKDKLDNMSASLPIASASKLGGVKVGSGLSITSDGTLSANASSGTADSVNWANVVDRPFNSVDPNTLDTANATLKVNTTNIATKADVNAKQNKLTTTQLNAINSGITATKVSTYDTYATSKQNALTQTQLNAINSGITVDKVAIYDGYSSSKANVDSVYTKGEIDNKIATIKNGTFQVVASLPASGEEGVIYLVGSDKNNYNRYTWENGEFIPLGSTKVDLTGYVKGSNLTAEQLVVGNGDSNVKTSGKAIETTLTNNANNIPTSSAVYSAVSAKANSTHTHSVSDINNLQTILDGKQPTLVNGVNIKTINGQQLVGSGGDIAVSGTTPNITMTATADNNTGTPSVEVVKGGTAEAPTFAFNFKNLKGAKGDKGEDGSTPIIKISATVDNNVGVPVCNVVRGGTTAYPTFQFNFKNLKGADGTGADRLVQIVNIDGGYIHLEDGKRGVNIANQEWQNFSELDHSKLIVLYFTTIKSFAYCLNFEETDIKNAFIVYKTEDIQGDEAKIMGGHLENDGAMHRFVFDDLNTNAEVDLSEYYTKNETNNLLDAKANASDLTSHTGNTSNPHSVSASQVGAYTKEEVDTKLNTKQDTLVSGTNIKTINNQNILGSGNINIESGSSFEIPEITLIPTSMSPISGTLTDDQIQILQNNDIIKFIVPTMAESCVFKMVNLSNQTNFFFNIFDGPLLMFLKTNIIDKTFTVSAYKFFGKVRHHDVPYNVQGNDLIFSTANDVDLYTISGTQLRNIIGYKDNDNPLGKYKIYEDTDDASVLVIEENW